MYLFAGEVYLNTLTPNNAYVAELLLCVWPFYVELGLFFVRKKNESISLVTKNESDIQQRPFPISKSE